MRPSIFLALFIITLANKVATAASLTEEVLQNEVHLSQSASAKNRDAVLILVDVQSGIGPKPVKKELIAEIARNRLRSFGVQSVVYEGNYLDDLKSKKVRHSELLSSKLVIEVSVTLDDPKLGYSSDCEISFIEPISTGGDEDTFVPQRTWYRRQNLKGISLQDVEDNLVQYIQKELRGFLPVYRAVRTKESRRQKMTKVTKRESGSGAKKGEILSYSLKWNDPDNRRNRFLFGLSAGTPAIGNLNFGFWGSRSFPLVVGVSGMYFDTAHRGLQLDLGVAFDNSGAVKQVAGLAIIGVNETFRNVSYQRDQFGRITETNTEIVNGMRFYAGPVYTLDWNNFRFQAGAGLKVQENNQSRVRALFQIGYTPPIGF